MSGAAATLYYGFYLGNPGDGWAARVSERLSGEANEIEDLSWSQAAEEDEDHVGHMQVHLLIEAEVEAAGLGSDELKAAVVKSWGVELVEHGDFPSGEVHIGIAMAGSVYETDDWTPKAIAPQTHGGNHMVLINALEALGMRPIQANPSWILAPGES